MQSQLQIQTLTCNLSFSQPEPQPEPQMQAELDAKGEAYRQTLDEMMQALLSPSAKQATPI